MDECKAFESGWSHYEKRKECHAWHGAFERLGCRVLIGLILFVASGCSTPAYVDKKDEGVSSYWPNKVEFQRNASVIEADCVSLIPFEGDKGGRLTKAFAAHLSVKAPISTGCSVTLQGSVKTYRSDNAIVASRTAAGVNATLVSDGKLLWSGEHTATMWGGGLPLDPFSALFSIVSAADNAREEQMSRVSDDLARRLVMTMPEFQLAPQSGPVEERKVDRLTNPRISPTLAVLSVPKTDVAPISMADRAYEQARVKFNSGFSNEAIRLLTISARLYIAEGRTEDAERAAFMIKAMGE
jgi:hypothetical protein